jgi:hypothetical protein
LKEIPSLLFLTGFFYSYVTGKRISWILYVLLGTVFRIQFLMVITIFLVADRFRFHSLRVALYMLIAVSAAYPILHLDVFASESAALFREESVSGNSFGAFVEFVRQSFPIASFFAILVRIFQSIFEPALTVISARSLLEEGNISVILSTYLVSEIICLPFWLSLPKKIFDYAIYPFKTDIMSIRLYTLCLAFIYPVAGFSFIHHRYLYPVLGLLLLSGSMPKDRDETIHQNEEIGNVHSIQKENNVPAP